MHDDHARHHARHPSTDAETHGYTLYTVTDESGASVATVLARNDGDTTGSAETRASNLAAETPTILGNAHPRDGISSLSYACSVVLWAR